MSILYHSRFLLERELYLGSIPICQGRVDDGSVAGLPISQIVMIGGSDTGQNGPSQGWLNSRPDHVEPMEAPPNCPVDPGRKTHNDHRTRHVVFRSERNPLVPGPAVSGSHMGISDRIESCDVDSMERLYFIIMPCPELVAPVVNIYGALPHNMF